MDGWLETLGRFQVDRVIKRREERAEGCGQEERDTLCENDKKKEK